MIKRNDMIFSRIPRVFLLACLFVFMITGCRRESGWKIGVSQCSSDDWREKMNEEILRESLFHDNVHVEIRSADDSSPKQADDLRYFVDNGFDLIIVSPNEAETLTPVIRDIYDSGIPVVVFDRNINGESYTAYQGADNREIGSSAARLAANLTGGECRAIEILGLAGSTPAMERRDGFHEIADQTPGFTVLGSGSGNWNYEEGARVADSLLALYPTANLIYAHNDRMAIAASDVAKRSGRDNIRIIGIDAAPEIGIRAVIDGVIDATFLYPTEGHQLLRTAIAILEGEPYERHLILPTASAVDASNAEMLLLQDNALKEETDKVEWLKTKVDDYWNQHQTQTVVLYSVVIILFLFAGLIFVLLRAYWNNVRHHKILDTKNRELERQRDELNSLYEQLQEATQSKLVFFTNVSHDLRTPLTLIADPVEQMAHADNLDEKQRTLMRLADKNVKILKRLINHILDFRKFENGKLTLNLVETDLSATVSEWAESFRNVAIKKHIRFTPRIDGGLTAAVDPEKFERIFFNLLSNAFKYTPENGEVAVSLTAGKGELTLTVSDTGQGISQENLAHIFDRFYQVDKINPNGSGIGLALVKAFAELHGGMVTVVSEKGKGSVFTVTLPLVHTTENAAETLRAPEPEMTDELADIDLQSPEFQPEEGTPTVLIIDDNADIRTMVKGLLCDRYAVLQASGGQQGIRLASKYAPDLIICDVMMPDMDGMETCRRLKSELTTSHIPVLMLTACSMDEQRIEGYECGADAYLSKPFNSRVLTARCEALILNRKRIQDALAPDVLTIPRAGDKDATAAAKAPVSDIDSDFYRKFVQLVDREMSNSSISVEDLASEMGLSRVQFYRKIKALTNYSPAELLRNMRLKRADMMLRTTELSISEILYSVGFSSPSYFTKCYHDYFGETPTEVQKRTSKI